MMVPGNMPNQNLSSQVSSTPVNMQFQVQPQNNLANIPNPNSSMSDYLNNNNSGTNNNSNNNNNNSINSNSFNASSIQRPNQAAMANMNSQSNPIFTNIPNAMNASQKAALQRTILEAQRRTQSQVKMFLLIPTTWYFIHTRTYMHTCMCTYMIYFQIVTSLIISFQLFIYIEFVNTLGAETFASRKICEIFAFREHKLSRIGNNRIFLVLNFCEWTEKVEFFVVLRKRLDPNK